MSSTMAIGNEKFKADLRQIAGVLFGFAICATFFPLANVSSRIGSDFTANEGVPLSSLIAGLCVIFMGLVGMLVSYLNLVHDYGNKYLTGFLLLWIQTAYLPWFTDMVDIGMTAESGVGFIPGAAYAPTTSQVRFVGAMGILGVIGYGASFLGSLAFMTFSLYAYQVGKPGDRSSGYYRGRLGYYSGLVALVGLVQIMLGSFIIDTFGNGPLEPPIGVAMFTVSFPEITVFVGIVYLLNGMYGMARAFGLIDARSDDNSFQMSMAFQWFCTLVLMILVQVAYLPGGALAAAVPSRACLTLGNNVMPAFLEYKMRSTPEEIPADYYGLDEGFVGDDKMKDEDIEDVRAT